MSNTLDTVRELVGRRHKISRQEMADILRALQRDGLDLRNGYMSGTVLYDSPDGSTGKPKDEQHPAAPERWANACRDITCISVDARGNLQDGCVRYDQPGSMHPAQHAELLFAPQELEHHEYDQIGQLRRRAKRVLVVRDDPELADPVGWQVKRKVEAWTRERNECAESAVHRVDAVHAHRLGLGVLSGLLALRQHLESARGPVGSSEVIVRLAPIIQLARGEAQDRLTAEANDPVEIPGIVSHMAIADDEAY